MYFAVSYSRCFFFFLFDSIKYVVIFKKKRVGKPALCPLAFHCLHTHSAASLSPITHTEDIQRVCQRGGHSARRPRQNRHLAQRWAGTKGPGQGSLWKAGAPHTLFSCFCFFFFSLRLSPLTLSSWNLLPPPTPHPSALPPPSFSPYYFAGLLGPLSERPLPLRHPLLVPPQSFPAW